jgi:hypothetical protein
MMGIAAGTNSYIYFAKITGSKKLVSLQDRHAFALDEEPWFVSLLVYNRNEDPFNILCYAP